VIRRFRCDDPEDRAEGLAAAQAAIKREDLVVLPTDTVYGVGVDAFSERGITTLLAAKGRGRDMPVPVLVGSPETLDALTINVPPVVRDLTAAFWPGALTIVCQAQPSLAWDLGDARGTVAVRMPDHPLTIELLKQTGPLGVSSANRTGLSSATTCDEAIAYLGMAVSVYLDDGPSAGAIPSTIIDATAETPRVLRFGALSLEALREVAPSVE
jgi:L-threonylcarbamoyladenylate synthase